jgi:putative tryptophan/tyrosine transport system substrate-binding protein
MAGVSVKLAAFILLAVLALASRADAAVIAVIKSKDVSQYNQTLDGFKARLGGKAEVKEFNLDAVGEGAIAAAVSAVNPNAIFAIGPAAAKIARTSFPSVPLVYAVVPNPDGIGLRGQNVTGVAMSVHPRKHFALFRQLAGSVKRVGVIYNPQKSQDYVDEGIKAAEGHGIQLISKKANGEQDVPNLLREMIGQIDAFWLIPDSTVVSRNSYKFILQNTLEKGIPLLVFSSELVKAGALVGLSPDFGDAGDKAAQLLEKIVTGTKADSLAISYPDGRLELNEQIAEKMHIKLPGDLLSRRGKIY